MGIVQVLPARLSNMIAAGEVVQRPSSVVKELLENAVDAGAKQISLIIKDAGRTLIQVIDDGCGMSADDALTCFQRHATSKIKSQEDLEKILTFGFRGEALASIASVAQITLKTRREEDEVGSEVIIEAGEVKEQHSVSQPKGTSIEVRNLFYNTPARRKFLKSDNVEFKHILEEFTRVAITRPDLSFSLSHNGKDVLVLKKVQGLKFRILDLLGSGVVGDVVDLNFSTSLISINGYIGRPESAKKSLGNQYLFVNGRFFKSAYLHKAIMNAYSEMTPEGLTPSYFIFMNVEPQTIDVNISPTKTEIKFENDSLVFQTLYACVRETLGRNGFGGMIDFDASAAVTNMPSGNYSAEQGFKNSEIAAAIDFESDYNPFDTPHKLHEPAPGSFYTPRIEPKQDYSALFNREEQLAESDTTPLVIKQKYICTQSEKGIMVTDIYRAQVRILYEEMLASVKGEKSLCQTALFPVQVQVAPAYIPLLEEHREMISKLGFDITTLGPDTIAVEGLPQGFDFDEMSVKNTVADLLQNLEEQHQSLPDIMQASIAKQLSQRVSIRNSYITPALATELLRKLSRCSNSELTPSGKYITRIITVEDLEKLF